MKVSLAGAAFRLQCPECGVPVETMETALRPVPTVGWLHMPLSVAILGPCLHEVETSKLDEAFG